MALIYRDLGQLERAAQLYERALTDQPEQAELWFNLGLVYRDLGRRDAAIQSLGKAVQLDPTLKERFPGK